MIYVCPKMISLYFFPYFCGYENLGNDTSMNDDIKNIPILNIPDLMERASIQPLEIYKDEMIIIDFDRRDRKLFNKSHIPSRMAAFSMIMTCTGNCTLHVNYIPYTLQPNMFIVLKENQVLSKIEMSEDFTGYHLIVKKDLVRVSVGQRTPPIKEVLELESIQPVTIAPEDDFDRLKGFMRRLINTIYLDNHFYQRELVQNALANVVLELWNITVSVSREDLGETQTLSLHEELILRFFGMVNRECKEKRDVSYYTTQLCVPPVYLTRIIKQLTGKTATKCISDILSDEAKLLLHQPNVSIQKVAEELNFSDQAAFSKFFKKNTGMSPVDYKRSLGIR